MTQGTALSALLSSMENQTDEKLLKYLDFLLKLFSALESTLSVYIERDMKVYLSFKRKTMLFTKGIPKSLKLRVSFVCKQMSSESFSHQGIVTQRRLCSCLKVGVSRYI
jgi:hypothetical protein